MVDKPELRPEEVVRISAGDGDERISLQLDRFPPGPGGRLAPELVAARAMWSMDSNATDRMGREAWLSYQDAIPYAEKAVGALRAEGYVADRPVGSPTRRLREAPVPRFEDEAALSACALALLEPYFVAETEVYGTHASGRRLRIDAILRPRDPQGWKDAGVAFGVEFKLAHQAGHVRSFMAWARQALDYRHVDWDGYGYLPVFTCPSMLRSISEWDGFMIAHLLGQCGVGELAPFEREGWAMVMYGDHVMWSERRGVVEAKHRSLRPHLGSE